VEIYWLVPQIGPVRLNLEDYSERAGHKFILEMTDTNIPYKKN